MHRHAHCTAVAASMLLGTLLDGSADRSRSAESSDVIVRRVPHGGIQPEAMRDNAGTVHLLYFAGEPRAGNLFYVRSADDGATFSAPARVNSQAGSAIAAGTIRGGKLAVGRDGRIHVVWNGSDTAVPKGVVDRRSGRTGAAMLYSRSNRGGTAFEPQRNLMRRSLALDGGGSVAADERGDVYVAWHGNDAESGNDGEGNRRVWIARSSDDGRTFAAETEAWSEPTGVCGCCGLGLFVGRSGNVHLLYRSATNVRNRDMYLLRSTDAARSFRGQKVQAWDIAACPMTSMAFVEGGPGVLGAWETAGQVYFGTISPDAPLIPQPIAPAPGAAGRKHPRMAVGARGNVLLVWAEGTAWARGGAAGWQVFNNRNEALGRGGLQPGVPAWSFAAPVTRRDGGFTIFY